MRKGFAPILILLIGLAMVAAGSVAYLQLKPKLSILPQPSSIATPSATSKLTGSATSPTPKGEVEIAQPEQLWERICEVEKLDNFDITVKKGEGLTHVARNALNSYIMALNLHFTPNPIPVLSSEEKVYTEDYIRKKLNPQSISVGLTVRVPCDLTEEAAMKARLLSIAQKGNLEQYSKQVTDYKITKMIQEIIDETTSGGGLKPYIFNF